MTGASVWLLLLICISVPATFCRHDFQYYISKYHKTSPATEYSSTSGTSTIVAETASTTGVSSLKDVTSSSEDSDSEENVFPLKESEEDGTVLQGDPYYKVDIQYMFIMRIVIIVGSVIAFVIVLGCMVCCCPSFCRGRQQRGFLVRDNVNADRAVEAHPHQPLVVQTQEPAVVVQHFPPNYSTQEQAQQFPPYPQQLPPQYPHQQPYYSPVQPQPHFSPNSMQYYNPPEAPPPYEDTPSHKY